MKNKGSITQAKFEIANFLPETFEEKIQSMNQGLLLDCGHTIGEYEPFDSVTRQELRLLIEDNPYTISYQIFGEENLRFIARFNPPQSAKKVFEIPKRNGIMLGWPIKNHKQEGVEMTVYGKRSQIKPTIKDFQSLGNIDLSSVGSMQNDGSTKSDLTSRQRDILKTAVSNGYYEIPKKCSQRAIANELEVSPGTVGEHLRKIESKILLSIVESDSRQSVSFETEEKPT